MRKIESHYLHATLTAALVLSEALREPPPPSPAQRRLLNAEDAALATISATFDVLRALAHPNAPASVVGELLDEARALAERARKMYSAISRIAGESTPK